MSTPNYKDRIGVIKAQEESRTSPPSPLPVSPVTPSQPTYPLLTIPDWDVLEGKPVEFPPEDHDADKVTTGVLDPDRITDAAEGEYLRVVGGVITGDSPSGTGDMDKATYDTDDDGAVDYAQGLRFPGTGDIDAGLATDGDFLKIDGTQIVGGFPTAAEVGLGNVDNVQQQPLDSDLTTIAGLTPTNDDILQRKAGAWANRTIVQLKTDLAYGALASLNTVGTSQIDNDAVTFDKTQNIATARIVGRTTASSGNMEELTGTQATALLDTFTSGAKGLVPASGGGTTNFLRADGSFAAPTASDPAGWTTIVKSANQDVTNAGVTNDTHFFFAVTAGTTYRIRCDFTFSGNNATGDHIFDFVVDAGTQKGLGTCQNLNASNAVQNIIVTANGVVGTTAIVTGTPADIALPIAVVVNYAFTASNTTTFRLRFGNSAASSGRTSRIWKGSILRYKSLA